MRKMVMGCAVAGLLTLSPLSVAKPSIPRAREAKERKPMAWEEGVASWYGEEQEGNLTASGEVFDQDGLTAAHRELPIGTKVKVTNLQNNKSLVLRINDRGPSIPGRLLDVTKEAARRLGFFRSGLVKVRIEVVSQSAGR